MPQTQNKIPSKRPYNRDYHRTYNRKNREKKRIWQYMKRHGGKAPPGVEPLPQGNLGNEKYQELIKEEREWLKKAPKKPCDICGYRHPPMTGAYTD